MTPTTAQLVLWLAQGYLGAGLIFATLFATRSVRRLDPAPTP